MAIDRKQFLLNSGCAAGGAVLGAFGRGMFARDTAGNGRASAPRPPAAGPAAAPQPASPGPEEERGEESYSQAGEDLIVRFFFYHQRISNITYLDIGANEPIQLNNTYYFYRRGFRGVLVEPN